MVRPALQAQQAGRQAGRVNCGWMPAHRVARNNCAVGPGVQRGAACKSSETATLGGREPATTVFRATLMQREHVYCALMCNIECLFLASIGIQTDTAVMTDSRIGLP